MRHDTSKKVSPVMAEALKAIEEKFGTKPDEKRKPSTPNRGSDYDWRGRKLPKWQYTPW